MLVSFKGSVECTGPKRARACARLSAMQFALVFLKLIAGQKALAVHAAGAIETDVIRLLMAIAIEDVIVGCK